MVVEGTKTGAHVHGECVPVVLSLRRECCRRIGTDLDQSVSAFISLIRVQSVCSRMGKFLKALPRILSEMPLALFIGRFLTVQVVSINCTRIARIGTDSDRFVSAFISLLRVQSVYGTEEQRQHELPNQASGKLT